MLASDIAEQHGVELISINVLINNDITRFTDYDLLDLKSILQKDSLLEYGYTRQQVANF